MNFDLMKSSSQLALPKWLVIKLPRLTSSRISDVPSQVYPNRQRLAPPGRQSQATTRPSGRLASDFRTGSAPSKTPHGGPLHSNGQRGSNVQGTSAFSFLPSLRNLVQVPNSQHRPSRSHPARPHSSEPERPRLAGLPAMHVSARVGAGMAQVHQSNIPNDPLHIGVLREQPGAITSSTAAFSRHQTPGGGSMTAPLAISQAHGTPPPPIRKHRAETYASPQRSHAPVRAAILTSTSPNRIGANASDSQPEESDTTSASSTSRIENNTSAESNAHTTEVYIDGHALGDWMLHHLEQALTRPPTSANFVMSHGIPTWPGQSPFV